jgi:hypothetical protein
MLPLPSTAETAQSDCREVHGGFGHHQAPSACTKFDLHQQHEAIYSVRRRRGRTQVLVLPVPRCTAAMSLSYVNRKLKRREYDKHRHLPPITLPRGGRPPHADLSAYTDRGWVPWPLVRRGHPISLQAKLVNIICYYATLKLYITRG